MRLKSQLWRIPARIDSIKADMKRDKARFGFIDDGRGLRYEVPVLQMRIMDLSGAYRYRTWFLKNFPDDIGEPMMLLAWTAMFFHRQDLKKAYEQLCRTVYSNLYIVPHVIDEPVGRYDIWHGSNCEEPEWFTNYDFASLEFIDANFRSWIRKEYLSESMRNEIEKFVKLGFLLKDEKDVERRTAIIDELSRMRYGEKTTTP
jgi:hypothetical protein